MAAALGWSVAWLDLLMMSLLVMLAGLLQAMVMLLREAALVVLAGVRSATLYVTYENLLSGTAVMPGTMLVPIYPLPEQRLRFGVFWPIFD